MDADTPTTGNGPAANLAARRAAGQVHSDPVQEKVVARLQAVYEQLKGPTGQPAKPGLLAWLGLGPAAKPAPGPHGLYIWGPVGRGKSMLMDLFFTDAPVAKKRRVHFHEFMLEVHERLHTRREELAARGAPPEADTIVPIAKAIASETQLLCFDEFQVTNIADAMILGRLFETLFGEGMTVIATSKAIEGIPATNHRHAWIEDDFDRIADAVVELLRDRGRSQALVSAARAFVEELDWTVIAGRYMALVGLGIESPEANRNLSRNAV